MSPDVHTLTGAYAADALPDDERRTFEAHLAECEACAQEVAELQATSAALAAAVAEEPPAAMKAAVMARIDTVRQEPPRQRPVTIGDAGDRRSADDHGAGEVVDLARTRQPWHHRLLAPAAAVLAIAVLGMTGIIANLNARISTMEAQTGRVADVVAAADAQIVEMAPHDGATARVVYSPTRGEGVFLADGLPAAPGEMVYELWFIGEDGPSPAGIFEADDRGRVTHVVTGDMQAVQAMAITVEPAGGSPEPTSEPIMVTEMPA